MKPIKTAKGFEAGTNQYAEHALSAAKMTSDYKEALAALKTQFQPEIDAELKAMESLKVELGAFAEKNRTSLLGDKAKSVTNAEETAEYGFRASTKVVTRDKFRNADWDDAKASAKLNELREKAIEAGEEVRAEMLKAGLKFSPPRLDKPALKKFDPSDLKQIGVDVEKGEEFFIKPKP